MSTKKIAFFASGSGSNIENIVTYMGLKQYNIQYLIFCNKPDAFVLERAKKLNIDSIVFDKSDLRENQSVLNHLKRFQPDLIVLAGFLWLMPPNIVQEFPNRIINIHPALLPDYGGKGMYGMRVHESVVLNKEKYSGITIHYVNEHYDEGKYILQETCLLTENDTAEDVASKVHALEYEHFPKVIEKLLLANS
ncbi:MAG: phosphoribosylglycinamide formyltransferase [Opitutaceae bacterium]|nr:phosphoribosylglycinamide formyltransferase [Cytophagales bacterium]